MLTDEDKTRIRLEEAYRKEVRDQLASDTNRARTRVWPFLNSPFGLWLLSSVVLAVVAAGYSSLRGTLEQRRSERDLIRKLDIELALRTDNFLSEIERFDDPFWVATPPYKVKSLLMTLDARSVAEGETLFAFAEFRDRPFSSLLVQLHGLVDQTRKLEIEKALTALRQIRGNLKELQGDAAPQEVSANLKITKEIAVRGLGRWLVP